MNEFNLLINLTVLHVYNYVLMEKNRESMLKVEVQRKKSIERQVFCQGILLLCYK
jgi:hypothetical protein